MQFYNQPDTIQAYFDSVIAVNGTACPLLHSCKHSAVARLSFIAIASLIALYISKNTRKFRPSQGGVIAAISFGTMLVVMAILLAFNPIENMSDLTGRKTFYRALKTALILMTDEKLPQKKTLMKSKVHLKKKKILAIFLR